MFHRNFHIFALALLLLVAVTGCTAGGGIQTPERDVSIDMQSALDAQNLAMNGLLMGSVEWTEAQFSSLLTELLKANSGEANPVESITAWFEPETLYLRVDLKDGVLPAAFGNTLELAGNISVMDNHLAINIEQAAAGGYSVSGAMLAPINAQINGALMNQPLGVPVNITIDSGKLTVGLAQ